MRRLGVIVALGTLLGMFGGMLTTSPAFAGRGHKWELVQAGPFTLPASICGFRVGGAFPVLKEYTKLLKASDGSMTTITTGSLKVSYTNLSTGKTITVKPSGPGKVTTYADGSVLAQSKGLTSELLEPADAQRFGLPRLSVIAGGLTTTIDANGNITSLTLHGHVLLNVCTALS